MPPVRKVPVQAVMNTRSLRELAGTWVMLKHKKEYAVNRERVVLSTVLNKRWDFRFSCSRVLALGYPPAQANSVLPRLLKLACMSSSSTAGRCKSRGISVLIVFSLSSHILRRYMTATQALAAVPRKMEPPFTKQSCRIADATLSTSKAARSTFQELQHRTRHASRSVRDEEQQSREGMRAVGEEQ